MNTGIYSITHVASGRVYVGSAKNFAKRWRVHKCLLNKGKHHSPHLQAAWNKHGAEAFRFEKQLVCSPENLLTYEQILIDGYRAAERTHGFNARPIAESVRGMKHSDATRTKIRKARALQVFSGKTKALWSEQRAGRKMPEGFGTRAREWKLGSKHTEAAKKLIGDACRGTHQSISTIEKKSKLTLAQVIEIRVRYKASGITQAALGLEYSLSASTVSLLVRGKRWALHLGSNLTSN